MKHSTGDIVADVFLFIQGSILGILSHFTAWLAATLGIMFNINLSSIDTVLAILLKVISILSFLLILIINAHKALPLIKKYLSMIKKYLSKKK